MIAQCKGKDLSNVSDSKLLYDGWLLMPKYDGNYVQIHKVGEDVKFYTSGGKQFYLHYIARDIHRIFTGHDIILEAEYIGNSRGLLGDRIHAAKLTTYRTNFDKGLASKGIAGTDTFMVFDILNDSRSFKERVAFLKSFQFSQYVRLVDIVGPMSLKEAKDTTKFHIKKGYEGCFIKHIEHINIKGSRVNNAIKLKLRPTADLLCLSILEGEGKYMGKIGSLVLQDKEGRTCNVGSGLSDTERNLPHAYFIGKIVEITYEQILNTYIQPTYSYIRADKKESD